MATKPGEHKTVQARILKYTVRRNLFNWKHEEVGNLDAKVKSFCAVPHLLRILKDFILFAEKEEELQKIILRQHQTAAVDKVVTRALDPKRTRGLVWHTQGSGKTYTMIKAAVNRWRASTSVPLRGFMRLLRRYRLASPPQTRRSAIQFSWSSNGKSLTESSDSGPGFGVLSLFGEN